MARLRVVQVGPYPPPHGGVQTNLVAIRNYLRQNGISCAVINTTRYRRQEEDEIYYPHSALELIWDLVRRRYDVIHLHIGGALPRRVIALALACTSIPWAKSVLTFHSGGFPSSDEGRAAKANSLLGFVLRRFHYLIGVNQEIVNFYLRLGVKRSRTRIIYPHSVAIARIAGELPEPLASFFAKYSPVLVSVCGLKPEYDIGRQIDAMRSILDTLPRAGLAILGSGELEQELRAQISRSGYADHVVLCGDVPHEVTLRAIADGDILLRTTLYDGDAISVREGLYLGTPVIATDNGMRPEGVHLIPIADTRALIAAVERIAREQPAKRDCGKQDEENLAQVLEVYREITNTR